LFVLYSACLFFGTLGVLVTIAPPDRALWIGLSGLALLGVLFIFMMFVRRKVQLSAQQSAVSSQQKH
jgi:hypothetical protein